MKKGLVFMLLFLPMISMAQQTDFSGKWNLNLQKTDFGQAPNWLMPKSLEVKQKKGEITIEVRVYDEQRVQHYYTEMLPFDGISTTIFTYDNNKRIVSLRWNADNKSFVLSVRPVNADDQPGADFTETWSLENDGKTLVLNRTATQANDYSVKAYYDKR